MKTITNMDYRKLIQSASRCARQQANMLQSAQERRIHENLGNFIKIIRDSKDEWSAMQNLVSEYGITESVARSLLEVYLSDLSSLGSQEMLEYYSKAAKLLSELMNEYLNLTCISHKRK